MTQDELKLVLEALKWCHGGEPCGTAEAIAVVKKALAQPEQEPVATLFGSLPVYDTNPPQRTWVGLTDEEIRSIWNDGDCYEEIAFAKDIEAELRSKNGY